MQRRGVERDDPGFELPMRVVVFLISHAGADYRLARSTEHQVRVAWLQQPPGACASFVARGCRRAAWLTELVTPSYMTAFCRRLSSALIAWPTPGTSDPFTE